MRNKMWFMEGLSSQREIVQAITSQDTRTVEVYASHRMQRNEILSVADFSLKEPTQDELRLDFITATVAAHGIDALHVGRNCRWFELHRADIETCGVSLTTGATNLSTFDVADSKLAFAEKMEACGLPVVPSLAINTVDELREQLINPPFDANSLCIKPASGIYGLGFWTFDESASPMASFNNPDNRRVRPDVYLDALEKADNFEPMVLMPYLPGPEYSVDMLLDKGKVIAGVARCKKGLVQELSNSGIEYDLAVSCAETMGADGLVNVQTRRDQNGNTVLLEINLRPSGGIGYTLHSGTNLPLLFALLKLGQISQSDARSIARNSFTPVCVRSLTQAVVYNHELANDTSENVSHA